MTLSRLVSKQIQSILVGNTVENRDRRSDERDESRGTKSLHSLMPCTVLADAALDWTC